MLSTIRQNLNGGACLLRNVVDDTNMLETAALVVSLSVLPLRYGNKILSPGMAATSAAPNIGLANSCSAST